MGARARLNAEERKEALEWRFFNANRLYDLGGQFVQRLPIMLAIVFGYLTIKTLAGHSTHANIVVSFFASAMHDNVGPWSVSGGFGAWALFERILRHKVIKRLGARIQVLEKKVDPHRTSSELAFDGGNNPEDSR